MEISCKRISYPLTDVNFLNAMNTPIYYQLILFLVGLGIISCGSGKTTVTGNNGKTTLVQSPEIHQDKTFENIKSNTERLCAMLSGEFVQYNYNYNSGEYYPWLVNDGKDSVIMYTVPVGEPNKIGYWLYYYQFMTSLPNDPIYEVLVHLQELNRDSIKAVYYEAPEDFNPPINEFLNKPSTAFSGVNFDDLKVSIDDEKVMYVRQNPLFFIGTSNLMPNIQIPGDYRVDYYEVKPSTYNYQIHEYDEDNTSKQKNRTKYRFIKKAMFRLK